MRFYKRKNPTFVEMIGAVFLVLMFFVILVDGIMRHMDTKRGSPLGGTAKRAQIERQSSD